MSIQTYYNNFIQRLKNNEFFRNILVVTSGTAIAQFFPLMFYPILARIYSPDEFGLLAIITSLAPIIAVISSGSYEGGILISNSKKSSANLAAYILIRSLLLLVLFFTIFLFLNGKISQILNEPRLEYWIFSIPFISFGMIIYSICNEWSVKYKYFKNLSLNKAVYTISNVMSKFLLGILKIAQSGGLILGDMIGKFISSFFVIYQLFYFDKSTFKKLKLAEISTINKSYLDFPKYMLPDQILSNVGGIIHVFFITAFFGAEELGYVAIVTSLLYMPITVLSMAIKDVFRQRAIDDFKEYGNCRDLYVKLLFPISLIAVFGFSILYFAIPPVLLFFLGEQWIQAGIYGQIMIPLFCLSFISMSLKDVFVVVEKMHIALYWQIFFIFLLSLSLIITTSMFSDIKITLYAMTIANSFSFLLYILLSYVYAKP